MFLCRNAAGASGLALPTQKMGLCPGGLPPKKKKGRQAPHREGPAQWAAWCSWPTSPDGEGREKNKRGAKEAGGPEYALAHN